MRNKNSGYSGGSGGLALSEVLLVVFIVLKLLGVINWSWWWVLSPLWISLIIVGLIFGGILIYYKCIDRSYDKKYKKTKKSNKE